MPTEGSPPLVHFNYERTETACRCNLCTGYRQAREMYKELKGARGRHHRFCRCKACTSVKDRFVDYLAAQNRLEVYSEMSYVLTATPKPHHLAADCLRWLYSKTQDPEFRDQLWWALSSDNRTLRTWMGDFQKEWGAQHGLPAGVWAVSGLYS